MDTLSFETRMESPGNFLKKEREARSIPLEDISNSTKIKECYLKAIEEDRYESLPHTLYVKGYIKGYAKYLSLNPNDIILQYENFLKSLIPPEPVDLPQPEVPPRKNVRIWFILSLIFAFILLVVLYISFPFSHFTQQKANTTWLFPVSPASTFHQQVGAQTILPDQKIEIQGLKKLKTSAKVTQ